MVEIGERFFEVGFNISLSSKEFDTLSQFHHILSMNDENIINPRTSKGGGGGGGGWSQMNKI